MDKKKLIEIMQSYFLLNSYNEYTEISDDLYDKCANEIISTWG